MNISKQISNEPITDFKRVVHYAGLTDYPAVFQPQNVPTIHSSFICEYLKEIESYELDENGIPTGSTITTDHLIKKIIFVFRIDNSTKVNPSTGSLDTEGIGEKDFFDILLSSPIVLSDIIEGYITELDNRGDWNEENWGRREVKPAPFVG